MKIRKLALGISLGALAIIAVLVLAFKDTALFNSNKLHESTVSTTGGVITYFPTDYGTHFNVELHKGGIISVGRETWEKDDEVVFIVSAKNSVELEIGIIPAENMDAGYAYDDYGLLIGKKVSVTTEVQEIVFTVPSKGEYGIGINHIMNDQEMADAKNGSTDFVNFTFELNKKFDNPLQK